MNKLKWITMNLKELRTDGVDDDWKSKKGDISRVGDSKEKKTSLFAHNPQEDTVGDDVLGTSKHDFYPEQIYKAPLTARATSLTKITLSSRLGSIVQKIRQLISKEKNPLNISSKERINLKRMAQSSLLTTGIPERTTSSPHEQKRADEKEKEEAAGDEKTEGELRPVKEGHRDFFDYLDFAGQGSDIETSIDLAKYLLNINEDLFLDLKDLEKKDKDKALVAQKASKLSLHTNIEDVHIGHVGTMFPVRFENQDGVSEPVLILGEVTPTSFLIGKKDDVETDHLMNTYCIVVEGDSERAIIRSGKIDTEQRANDFFALLKEVRGELIKKTGNESLQLRVCSHQLNGFEVEGAIIKAQHRQLARINTLMQKEGMGEVVHLNSPTNRFYNLTKAVRQVPVAGNLIEKYLLTGERKSKEQNLEGLGTYLKWLNESMKGEKRLPKYELEGIAANVREINRLEQLVPSVQEKKHISKQISNHQTIIHRLQKLKRQIILNPERFIDSVQDLNGKLQRAEANLLKLQEIFTAEEQIKARRAALRAALGDQYTHLKGIEDHLRSEQDKLEKAGWVDQSEPELNDPEINTIREDLQKVSLMRKVLGSQLDLEEHPTSRGQEELTMQDLDDALNVVSGVNCKSGLDRTGLFHSLMLAGVKRRNRLGQEKAYALSDTWDQTTQKINLAIAQAKPGEDPMDSLLGGGSPLSDAEKQEVCDVIEYRKMVLSNLIRVGIPITQVSTGLIGMKWNSGLKENLIPLNFLPPFVEVGKDKKVIQLVKFDQDGQITGLTVAGQQLLIKLSAFRGS